MLHIQQRDETALEHLYERYSPVIRSVIMKTIHNEAEANDLLQEIFMEIWNRAAVYDPAKGRPLGWVVTLGRRRAIDRLRKAQAYARAGERMKLETETHPDSWMTDPNEDYMNGDTRALLQKVMLSLPVAQREAIDLAFYKGMSQRGNRGAYGDSARDDQDPAGAGVEEDHGGDCGIRARVVGGLREALDALAGWGGTAWSFLDG